MSAPTAPRLTARQRSILAAVRDLTARYGYPPSLRDTAGRVGLASTSSVAHHVFALVEAGMLVRPAGAARAVTLTDAGRRYLDGPPTLGQSDDAAREAGAAAFDRMAASLDTWAPELARTARTWAAGVRTGSATTEWAAAMRALLATPHPEETT